MHGFLSYSHSDNSHGLIDAIVKVLQSGLAKKSENKLGLAYDKEHLTHGVLDDRIKSLIEGSTFFIAIISTSYCDPDRKAYLEFQYALKLAQTNSRFQIIPLLISDNILAIKKSDIWATITRSGWLATDLGDLMMATEVEKILPFLKTLASVLCRDFIDAPTQVTLEQREALRNIAHTVQEIGRQADASTAHMAFRRQLISNILDDVLQEIRHLNSPSYEHNISLDKSFVTRARAIFKEAEEIFAVSVDSSSSFWLNDSTKSIAAAYTMNQPIKTHRVFVFSSPTSMLRHRCVLEAHHQRYGSSGGRVLMTSRRLWQAYLSGREPKAASRTNEDFGILRYKGQERDVLATLTASQLSFRELEATDPFFKFYTDFCSDITANPSPFEEPNNHMRLALTPFNLRRRMFWLWRDDYANTNDPTPWYHCVMDVFDGDIDFNPVHHKEVMHNILFSPRPDAESDEAFRRHIKEMTSQVLKMRAHDGESLVRSIWFGKISNIPPGETRDALHGHSLYFDEDVRSKWRYCLTMKFRSEEELLAYYNDADHAQIRRALYSHLDQTVAGLYAQAGAIGESNGEDASMKGIIEKIMSKHLLRLDYVVPRPFMLYDAIDAVPFPIETGDEGTATE